MGNSPNNGLTKAKSSNLPLNIFESSRKPHKKKFTVHKKVPYVHKKKPQEELIKIKTGSIGAAASIGLKPKAENFIELDSLLKGNNKTATSIKNAPLSLLPQQILTGDMDSTKTDAIREKYASKPLPLPQSKKELKKRVSEIIAIIPSLLDGTEELSYHYTRASEQRKQLKNATMSSNERWDVDWSRYIGGFYGLRRQTFISTLIQTKYAELLSKNRNKTVLYWSADMFCTYVLANEIILRLVMADTGSSKEEAEKIMKDTVDYGSHIADEETFADDLSFEEFQVI